MGTKTNNDKSNRSGDNSDLNKSEETTSVVSSSVSESQSSAKEIEEVAPSAQQAGQSKEDEQSSQVSDGSIKSTSDNEPGESTEIVEPEKTEPIVETVYLDDSKVGIQYSNYPLSSAVVKALNEMGHRYLSRYQQTLLDSFTAGEERWFSVNLASNRGLVIGTYLVDLAQTDLTKTTSILCVAVPKIRSYFERDLLAIAKYTGVRILSIPNELPEGFVIDEVPNIVIASIENVARLKSMLDFSTLEVLYFDEVEKTIRDAEALFLDFVNQGYSQQVVMQSSYYSQSLIETVHQCKPELNPTRIFKHHKTTPAVYSIQNSDEDVEWVTCLEQILPHYLLQRMIIVSSNVGEAIQSWLSVRGWDTFNASSLNELPDNVVEDLKENRIQILILNEEQFMQNTFEFEVLIHLDDVNGEEQVFLKKNKRLQAMFYKSSKDTTSETRSSLADLTSVKHSENVVHMLRQQVLNRATSDWSDTVDELLAQPDGKHLLGEALRLALQNKRGEQGYIRSNVYKLESRDVFQKRNRRKSR